MWKQLLFVAFAVNAFFFTCAQVKCDRPNEHYKCGSACQTTCENYLSLSLCPVVNVRCTNACYCVDGFVRNDSGICIPISECEGSSSR
ncbi:unnamed protein product [Arctia plantaginis]|uniref:TIL domain-containing protein n=1 Tax=Arctia plantaginis TaxID=874455 RepID=A0A8S1ABL2_ARCPL|nr:unnamed protein product [Arctia plantaginis]